MFIARDCRPTQYGKRFLISDIKEPEYIMQEKDKKKQEKNYKKNYKTQCIDIIYI